MKGCSSAVGTHPVCTLFSPAAWQRLTMLNLDLTADHWSRLFWRLDLHFLRRWMQCLSLGLVPQLFNMVSRALTCPAAFPCYHCAVFSSLCIHWDLSQPMKKVAQRHYTGVAHTRVWRSSLPACRRCRNVQLGRVCFSLLEFMPSLSCITWKMP